MIDQEERIFLDLLLHDLGGIMLQLTAMLGVGGRSDAKSQLSKMNVPSWRNEFGCVSL